MSPAKTKSPKNPPSLREANQQIVLSGAVALDILRELEFMLISLRKMSDHAIFNPEFDFDTATGNFVIEGKLRDRLAKVRALLSEPFDGTLGDDDMGDIERYVEDLEFWKPS